MSCTRCQDQMSELVQGELPQRRAAELRAHIGGCVACARAESEMRATLSLLRRLGREEEPLPPDFSASLHRALVAAGPPDQPGLLARLRDALSWRPLLPATAGAALAALVLGGLWLTRHHEVAPQIAVNPPAIAAPTSGPVEPVFRVPHDKVAMVKIDFVAAQATDDVEFAVVLPEGLRFVSRGHELPDREFHWRGRLEEGSNPIPVAVRGAKAGRYVVAAKVTGVDVNAEHQVVLEVTAG